MAPFFTGAGGSDFRAEGEVVGALGGVGFGCFTGHVYLDGWK